MAAQIWRGDVAGLAAVRRLVGGRPVIGAAFLALGIVFGVLAAVTGAFDLLDGWLVAAYLLIAALLVVNASPWVQRLPKLGAEAVEAEAGERLRREGPRRDGGDPHPGSCCCRPEHRPVRGDHSRHGAEAVLTPVATGPAPLGSFKRTTSPKSAPVLFLPPKRQRRAPTAPPCGLWRRRPLRAPSVATSLRGPREPPPTRCTAA